MNKGILTRSVLLVTLIAVVTSAPAPAAPAEVQSASLLGNRDAGKSETAIGDLVADAIRAALRTDVALVAASELKPLHPPLEAGKVKVTDITALAAYPEDRLAVLSIDGKTLKAALEKSVSIYPQPSLGFLQVSGLRFTLDPSKKQGERVVAGRVGNAALDDGKTYTVGLSMSLAKGALGYWRLWSDDAAKPGPPGITTAKAIENYLAANRKIDYSSLDRITIAR